MKVTNEKSSRSRLRSFDVNESAASGMLNDILQDCDAYLGGCSLGKGFQRAAQNYMKEQEEIEGFPVEDPFYVVDIGVVVSQVYQWRRFFPRVDVFYAVKCNPDPVLIQTLAALGCNFDCASQGEMQLVQSNTKQHERQPEIIYANPCKAASHIRYAVQHGVRLMTFDNVAEVEKCARVQKMLAANHKNAAAAAAGAGVAAAGVAPPQQQQQQQIQLILRIVTDDRGAQCRLSSKFGAPPHQWRALLAAAAQHQIPVVGVSFHVGSGCRDASRYEAALQDARKVFDMAKREFDMDLHVLDIGGGFPGETHSMWNPAVEIDEEEEKVAEREGKSPAPSDEGDENNGDRYMFFTEIAEEVAPMIDSLFPAESGVRIIAEPGRYMVAACATLCCQITSMRSNATDNTFAPSSFNESELLQDMSVSNDQRSSSVHVRAASLADASTSDANVLKSIHEELADYSMLYANQQIAQQDVDAYNDNLDLYKEGFETAKDLLGLPDKDQALKTEYTMEGMNYPLVAQSGNAEDFDGNMSGFISLAAAGEAAVSGLVVQCVADSDALQDDYAYYMNDGVYGAFNNIMFDHASCRARVLKTPDSETASHDPSSLFASTVFGPTCDSIDVIARSVLLPKLKCGDWLYFENMGAYTSAAASGFNGFVPSTKKYVCSVQPEFFEALIAGPDNQDEDSTDDAEDEKKDQD